LTKQLARLKREAEDYYRDTVSTPTAEYATSSIDTTTRTTEVSISQKLHLIADRTSMRTEIFSRSEQQY
jgi:hypothetical protein